MRIMCNDKCYFASSEEAKRIISRGVLMLEEQKRTKWRQFKEETSPSLPYPQNLLFGRLFPADFFYREAERFFTTMSDEEKADILAGVEWALQTLPTKMRLAIEYHYRDGLRPKDGGKLLSCTGKEFTSLRKRGEQRIRYIANPVYHVVYENGLTKAKEQWDSKMEQMTPTPISELDLPDYIVKMLQEKMFLVTSDITTSEWRYCITNLATCYDLPLTKEDLEMIDLALAKAEQAKRKSLF